MNNTQEGTAKKITAPFTPGQVKALNRYQKEGRFHPFTCGNKDAAIHLEDTLVATVEGWICPYCDYKQNWAHAFMAYPLAYELEAPTTTQEGLTAEQEKFTNLKWEIGQIFVNNISWNSDKTAIEGNPAIHRITEYVMNLLKEQKAALSSTPAKGEDASLQNS